MTAPPPDDDARFQAALEAAKLEALAEFAAGAGHEINNPLATIVGRAQMLLQGETDPERRQALATIGGQALRIRDMIGDAMLFARPPQPEPESLPVGEIVRSVCAKLRDEANRRGVMLQVEADESAVVWADRVQFAVALSSLVRNSLEAVDDGGQVRVSAQPVTGSGRPLVRLTVTDNGPGLGEQDRAHLFDPFYSGRPAGRGLGFGLSKCWRIVTLHGGRIEVDSRPSEQTTFRVLWPATGP